MTATVGYSTRRTEPPGVGFQVVLAEVLRAQADWRSLEAIRGPDDPRHAHAEAALTALAQYVESNSPGASPEPLRRLKRPGGENLRVPLPAESDSLLLPQIGLDATKRVAAWFGLQAAPDL